MPFTVPVQPTQYIKSQYDNNVQLAVRIWKPSTYYKSKIRAICIIVHGIGWHSGYYDGLSQRLNRDGIIVIAYDQYGMGYSRNYNNNSVHHDNIEDSIHDMMTVAVWAKQQIKYQSNNIPFFFIGECTGSIQVLTALLGSSQLERQYGITISGVIMLSAMLQQHSKLLPIHPLHIPVLRVIRTCFPTYPWPIATDYMMNTFDISIGNRDWVHTAKIDPAVSIVPQQTLSEAFMYVDTAQHILKMSNQFRQYHNKIFTIHAINDCYADCQSVKQFIDEIGSLEDNTVWIQDSKGHHLLLDRKDITENVKNKIAEWIVKQT